MTTAVRLGLFDTWQPGYGGATVNIYLTGTTTAASVYTNEGLTTAADNPQTLDTLSQNGISYGKWVAPIYVGVPVDLVINSTDNTGVIRVPLTTLDAVDASKATVKRTGQTTTNELEDIVARVIYATDFGALVAGGGSGAANNTTLTAAIGAATGQGGGVVLVPAGTYAFTSLTVPTNVTLEGQGRGVTTLQSQTASNVITFSGDRAGLSKLTLDGVNLTASGVGVFAKGQDETIFEDVEVKRFETGLHFKGGRRAKWSDLYLENCTIGAKLHGDINSGGGSDGDLFTNNEWKGGKVSNCTTYGIDLSYEDRIVSHNAILDVGFEDNTGSAIRINGARYTRLGACWWSGNTTVLTVLDDTLTNVTDNTVIGLFIVGGKIASGAISLRDVLQDVIFDGVEISGSTITLTVPQNSVQAKDCTESSTVTISGDGTKWVRWQSSTKGASSGLTTDATATKAWAITLSPGQVGYLEAKVIGNQRNGTNTADYHITTSCKRAGSTLAYDTQTANFTLGLIATGTTSGATGRIIADADAGATGTLTLRDISGVFLDNEIITDTGGGSATVNGTLVAANAALLGSITSVHAAREDVAGWDATFVANGPEIELRVTGAAATTIEWLCDVDATLT